MGTDPETYTFTFSSGACGASSDANPAASAVAVRYTGVDPASPIDDVKSAGAMAQSGAPTAPAATAQCGERARYPLLRDGRDLVHERYDVQPAGHGHGHWSVRRRIVAGCRKRSPPAVSRSERVVGRADDRADDAPLDHDRAPPEPVGLRLHPCQRLGVESRVERKDLRSERRYVASPRPAAASSRRSRSPPCSRRPPSTASAPPRPTSVPEFDFRAGTCSGTPIGANASALAVRYTGVNPLSPIDPVMQQSFGVGTGTNRGTTPVAPAVTTNGANEQIVRLYGLGGASALSGLRKQRPVGDGYEHRHRVRGRAAARYRAIRTPASASSTGRNLLWIAQTFALVPSGTGCSNNCWYGVQALSNSSTSYSGAITSAQNALAASNRPDAQKVIIFLSDGAANTPNGSNPCQAGISAAQTAEAAGTWVYTIAYDTQGDTCTQDNVSMTGLCAMHLIADNQVTDPDYAGDTLAQTQAGVCTGNQSVGPAKPLLQRGRRRRPHAGVLTDRFLAVERETHQRLGFLSPRPTRAARLDHIDSRCSTPRPRFWRAG